MTTVHTSGKIVTSIMPLELLESTELTSGVFTGAYKGCSNIFITFFKYVLQQNGKRFYKGLYVTFKLAPDIKKKYSILVEL